MRKLLIIISSISVIVFALYSTKGWTSLWVLEWIEKKLEADCPSPPFNDSCITRMRATGHSWSSNGDLVKAKKWYQIAADNGDISAMFHLGWIYQELAFEGRENHENNTDELTKKREFAATMEYAMEWYQKSAENGFAPAMNNLGQLYLHGNGKIQNEAEAFKWHLAAAKAGNPVGAWNVMIAYNAGQGVEVDTIEAKKWQLWNPKNSNPKDISSPTLERTILFGTKLPPQEVAYIKKAAKEGVNLDLLLTPLE